MPEQPDTTDVPSSDPTTSDWVRAWAAVVAVVATMIGSLIWLLNVMQCGCTTAPPA